LITRKGILFVISGPSGVGKGTVRSAVLPQVDDMQISISATTRPPREGEIDGQDYFFTTPARFQQMIDNGELLEWASVYGNLYGTPQDFVTAMLSQGNDVLLEIDIQGALQVKKKMPAGVFIFISPPTVEELSRRLCGRGNDSEQSIQIRLGACQEEMSHMKYYDYVVVNDRIEDAVEKVRSIITAERCKRKNLNLE
jgi:guanylate kinase